MTKLINDWLKLQVIHKKNIINFEWLDSNGYIKEIVDDYYYLNERMEIVETEIYKYFSEKLQIELELKDINTEIKKFISNLHLYNEMKDIGETLVNKLATKEGITSKEMFKKLEYDFE